MIPNIVTGIRIVLAVLIILTMAAGNNTGNFKPAAMLFLVAVATDMLDGLLARRFKMESTFGAMFDLVADRLIMTPSLLFLFHYGLLDGTDKFFFASPKLYVLIIVAADVMVLAGIFMYVRLRKSSPDVEFPTPTRIVKATYPAQAAVVFFALLLYKQSPKTPVFIGVLMYVAAILTVVSFISYMKKGGFVFKGAMPLVVGDIAKEFSEEEEPEGEKK